MLRKDTKKYREIVSAYCSFRKKYEKALKDIEYYSDLLSVSDRKYEELKDIDPQITEWYDGYTSVSKMALSFKKNDCEKYKIGTENYGSCLVEDYGDNLEKIYNTYSE